MELENGLFKLAFHMVNGRVIQGHAHLEPKEGVVIVSLINFDHQKFSFLLKWRHCAMYANLKYHTYPVIHAECDAVLRIL